jgi:hypothetical protein
MRHRIFITLPLFVILVFMAVAVDSPKAVTKIPADPKVLRQFDDLESYISSLAETVLPRGQRNSLVAKLDNSEAAYRRGQPCTAANMIGAYLNETQALRKGTLTGTAEALYVEGRRLLGGLLSSLQGNEKCSGHERFGMEPAVTIKSSDNKHLAGSVRLGEPRMVGVGANGKQFTQLMVPGTESKVGTPGLPGVPLVHRLVAAPRGATVSLRTPAPTVAETCKVNLLPFQNPPVDGGLENLEFVKPPFVIDAQAYASAGPFPSQVCTITPVGQLRDLSMAMISCAVGQYYPASNNLVLFDSIDFGVEFAGGSGAFVTNASFSPFENQGGDPFGAVLNGKDVPLYAEDRPLPSTPCPGEELIIVTHVDFRQAADKLAEWKRDKGIATNVVVVNNTSKEQIADYIKQRYEQCVVRPSYVLLLGDSEFIPPFYKTTTYSPNTGTDYGYALLDQFNKSGLAPDFAVGRIPVDTLQQAMDVVNKIVKYESDPPSDQNFYNNISIASMFQCCELCSDIGIADDIHGWDQRHFIEDAEWARNGLLAHGYAVERIYTEDVDSIYLNQKYGCMSGIEPKTTPKFYSDGTPLPDDLQTKNGFTWDGSTEDIIAAFNSGRFLILQIDHGDWEGWGHPKFKLDDISQNELTNDELLPVVYGASCVTAMFDNEANTEDHIVYGTKWISYPDSTHNYSDVFFGERLLRQARGGVIGYFGMTRIIDSNVDSALFRGFLGAVWPDLANGSSNSKGIRRLGDILNLAKKSLLSQLGVVQAETRTSSFVDGLYLEHLFGDPTLEMWTSKPAPQLSDKYQLTILESALLVQYSVEGATVTALQKKSDGMMAPIGRAKVNNGEAHLEYVVPPEPGYPIVLSASMENAVSRLLTPPSPVQAVDLQDESTFSDTVTRINFDDDLNQPNDHINIQYQDQGVCFVDNENTSVPIIVDDRIRQGSTKSLPYSLFNGQGSPDPGSINVPLTMNFTPPVRRVGMYIGNGLGFPAVLRAYGEDGDLIFSVTRTGFGNDVKTFIGMDVGFASIVQVQLDYGDTLLGEEIDDLIFE